MAEDVKGAIGKMDANFASFNTSLATTGKASSDLDTRISKTLADMKNGLAGAADAHEKAAGAAKAQSEELKKLKQSAEDAIKPIIDKIKENFKAIEELRKKINETKDKWKEFKQEGVKALSEVNNEIQKLKKEAGEIQVKFKGEQDSKLSDRYVQVLKDQKQAQADLASEQAKPDQSLDTIVDLQTQLTSLAKERQLIENGTNKNILDQAIAYDGMSQTEKIILDLQKQKTAELDENAKKQAAAQEKQTILEAQSQQKKIGDLQIHTQVKDGMMTASIELEKGKRTEIHDAENIALANDIAQKQLNFKTEYDTLTQQLASKYEAQKSNIAVTADMYKQFNAYLKDDTKKTAAEMITYLNQVAENLRQVIALRAQAGMGSGGTSVAGNRAFGGPVDAGKPYLVGERGPEVIIPNQNSVVAPNSSLGGGGLTINVNMGNVQVGNVNDAKTLTDIIKTELTRTVQLYKLGIS